MEPVTTSPATETNQTPEAVRDRHRRMLWASVVALVVGTKLTVLLHEGAHWVVGAALGSPSRLYSYAVEHTGELSPTGEAAAALAGPIFSLLLGLVFTYWQPLRRTAGVWHLVWLWFGFTSLQEAVTYLVITPVGAGDMALAADRLGWHPVVIIGLSLVGVAGMFWQARRFADHIRSHCGDDVPLAYRFAFYPWLIGSAVLIVIQLVDLAIGPGGTGPAENVLIVFASMSIIVFGPMGFIFWKRSKAAPLPLVLPRWPLGPMILLAILLVINIALLLTGPTLG